MSLYTLKYSRLIIPGIIFLIYAILFNDFELNNITFLSDNIKSNSAIVWFIYTLIALLIGSIYHILNIRYFLWDNYLPLVQQNIRNRLIKIGGYSLEEKVLEKFSDWRTSRDIFYQFVDSSESLKQRGEAVRFNGWIWTSIMDIALISLFVSFLLFLKGLIWSNHEVIISGYIVLGVAIICLLFVPIITKSHIKLSDTQLDLIEQNFSKEVKNKIDAIMQ